MENRTSITKEDVTTGHSFPSSSAPDRTLPLLGYPGFEFYAIHINAITSLSISILVSTGVLIYLMIPCSSGKEGGKFFQRPIGDRLVVYLALVDLLYSVSHELDHCYMLAVKDHPPPVLCIIFAFFLQTFALAQSLVILYTAISAMTLVVFEKKIGLGRYDWRLIVLTLGVPVIVGIAGALIPFLGPSGAW